MPKLIPSSKSLATYAVALIMGGIQLILARYGYKLPDDLGGPLTGFITALVPHVWEVIAPALQVGTLEKTARVETPK